MVTGIVKFFDKAKGFGFIREDGTESDTFVHISALELLKGVELKDGDAVKYDVVPSEKIKGKEDAINVDFI